MPQLENLHGVIFIGDGVVQMKLDCRQQDAPQIGDTRMRHGLTGSGKRSDGQEAALELGREEVWCSQTILVPPVGRLFDLPCGSRRDPKSVRQRPRNLS